MSDHAPLAQAAVFGSVLPLYIIEPSLLGAPDFDHRHFAFIRESLIALNRQLQELGQPLCLRVGEAVDVLETVRVQFGQIALWSHEETGNTLTYKRDRAVAAWAEANRVRWTEIPQCGVIRALKDRNRWSAQWELRMAAAPLPIPARLDGAGRVQTDPIPDTVDVVNTAKIIHRQSGGEHEGQSWLRTFFEGRGSDYRRGMSSPATGATACSRVSPYLAWGCLSVRQAYHAALDAQARQAIPSPAIRSFVARLHWHCHFMQKLESQPEIEFVAFHPGLDRLREEQPPNAEERLQVWLEGRTGFPFVDACMRSLRATGWLNFRMRAMLVSFAAYDLWLDWRVFKDPLARLFLDYEPGIHISQCQMQSGTTGINTLRIYNPIKQGLEHDPRGVFIRQWIPELQDVPAPLLHCPTRLVANGTARAYPRPIVSHLEAVRAARSRIAIARADATFREESERVFKRHGSRKVGGGREESSWRARHGDGGRRRKSRNSDGIQRELDFRTPG